MIEPLSQIGSAVLNAPAPRHLEDASPHVIELSRPRRSGVTPLLNALAVHRTSPDRVHSDVLGELIWVANGIRRDTDGAREARSALGGYEIAINVLPITGLSRYEPLDGRLVRAALFDPRATTGDQDFLAYAPVDLLWRWPEPHTGRVHASTRKRCVRTRRAGPAERLSSLSLSGPRRGSADEPHDAGRECESARRVERSADANRGSFCPRLVSQQATTIAQELP
jgi:hypothetical protein